MYFTISNETMQISKIRKQTTQSSPVQIKILNLLQGGGDENTTNDIIILDCHTVMLRSERHGGGNGRVYTINFEVNDTSGNTATGIFEVWVPHDLGFR